MDSIAQQIAAWLAAQGNRPRGPLVPMSAGGVPMPYPAQTDQSMTLGGRVNSGPAPAAPAAPYQPTHIIGRRG